MVHNEVLPTLSHKPGQGVFTFYGSAIIDAPAHEVYKAIRDFESYPHWNLYMPQIDTPSGTNEISVGDNITLHYRPEPTGSTMAVPCEIIAIDDAALELSWRGLALGIPMWFYLPEKVHRVTPRSERQCLFEVWETQSGPMAYGVKWMLGAKLSAMGQGIANGLKKHVESQS